MDRVCKIFFVIAFLFVFSHKAALSGQVLVVGTSADYKPFTFYENGTHTGFDIELVNIIGSKLGYKIQIKTMQFNELIPALAARKIDLAVSAITATHERAQLVDFSMKYYLPNFALVYVKDKPIASVDKLENKIIAVPKGSTMETFLVSYSKDIKILPIKHTSGVVETLQSGQADCALIESVQARNMCVNQNNIDYIDTKSSYDGLNYAIAFPKGSNLRYKVDDIMLQMKIFGEFERMAKKWLKPNDETYEGKAA